MVFKAECISILYISSAVYLDSKIMKDKYLLRDIGRTLIL